MIFQIFVYISLTRLFKGYYKYCDCGCKKLIRCVSRSGVFTRFISGHNSRGLNHHFYKNGRFKMGNNYYMIRIIGYFSADKYGRVYEHVYFYQEYHKCCLLPWGEIHHIEPVTEDYCNNMIWNLMGVTKTQHRKIEWSIRKNKHMNGAVSIDNYV